MFSNFIYFLVALILYSTSEFPGTDGKIPQNALITSLFVASAFFVVCRMTFRFLERRAEIEGVSNLDHLLEKSLSRLSILALGVFAFDLYILRLNLILDAFYPFKLFPTLEAMIFLLIFLFYLVIVWDSAWNLQKRYFAGYLSKKSFVISNISFSLPALLPWFILSFTADLIELIPFRQPKGFLATPLGEITYVLLFLVGVACFGPLLIKKIWGCTSLESGYVRTRIESLCRRSGLKYADILKWDLFGGSMITAGIMGLWGKYRYILVTPAMVNSLYPDEIDAVIAHEIGHIQKKHIHFYLLFFAGYIACVYSIFDPMVLLYYSDPLVRLVSLSGLSHETGTTLILSLVLILIFLLYFRYVFGYFMRNFERQADLHVYLYMPDSSALIRTFLKIAGAGRQSWDKPNWHHYSIKERVEFLQRCETIPGTIESHNRKVKKMMLGYVAVIIFICSAGYYFNFGQGKELINGYIAEKIIAQELEGDPQNLEMLLFAADYYYDRGNIEKAVLYYRTVISIDPEDSHALNNLAWLYATTEDPEYRKREAALELAERALKSEIRAADEGRSSGVPSHVLDTYAEACFVNGRYEDALKAARDALHNASDKEEYYLQQVMRFEKAALKKSSSQI